jgi:signal transduction histidine kinase
MTRRIVGRKTKSTPTPIELVTNPRLEVHQTSESPSSDQPDRSNQPLPGESFGSEFLDNVAHQMVAPLQAIQMNCQNIIDGIVPKTELETRLKEVVGHSKILADFARRMRFLHELVSGKTIDAERMSFKDMVTAWIDGHNNYLPTMRILNVEADIHHKKMNKLPDIVASRLAAHQVIMNLYDNAMKYGAPNSRIDVNAVRDGDFVINTFSHRA